jgi:hypothetical protein
MIALSAEVGLMLLVLSLYVYESSVLLFCNQAVLSPVRAKGWQVQFGLKHLSIRGKELCFAQILMPWRPLFVLTWRFENSEPSQQESKSEIEPPEATTRATWQPPTATSYQILIPLVWWLSGATFIVLPLGLFTSLGDTAVLSAGGMLYLGILILLLVLWRYRSHFQLSKKEVLSLGFEYVICPPFALNIIRRLSLKIKIEDDLEPIAHSLQSPQAWLLTCDLMLERLDDQIAYETQDTTRYASLLLHRQKLEAQK